VILQKKRISLTPRIVVEILHISAKGIQLALTGTLTTKKRLEYLE